MLRCCYLLLCWLLINTALAQTNVNVPAALAPWQDWVLHDYQRQDCPRIPQTTDNSHSHLVCSWSSPLELQLNQSGGQFKQAWSLLADGWISLPGDNSQWPQQVLVNGQAQAVSQREGRPQIWLKKGQYQLSGQWQWSRLPEALILPSGTVITKLSLNGQAVLAPVVELDGNDGGRLLLNTQNTLDPALQENQHSVQLFRKIIDDMPLQVLTHIELNVSGEARELNLGALLLADSIPLTISSELPIRIEQDGSLKVQARPGQWQLEISSRFSNNVTTLSLPDKLNKEEVWVFEAKPQLRQVELTGLSQVDPRLTRVPADWQQLPAYRITPGQSLQLTLKRRGNPAASSNRLSLTRKIWLDFEGKGYTIADQIQGQMNQAWRLGMSAPYQLGRVNVAGEDQLITQWEQQAGVELRQQQIKLLAESRVNQTDLSHLGWQSDFDQASGSLMLPPGYQVLHISGVDQVSQSWIQRWTLLDLFLVLIISLIMHRLWNLPLALLAAALLTLTWHESEAPKWLWLNIVTAVALWRVLPAGRIKNSVNLYRWGSMLLLLLLFINYSIDAVREGLYPQLEKQGTFYSERLAQTATSALYDATVGSSNEIEERERSRAPERIAIEDKALMEPPAVADETINEMHSSGTTASERTLAKQKIIPQNIDPNAKRQTGPGMPTWQWHQVNFAWSGPVRADQSLQFWLLTPTMHLLLNLLSVILMALLIIKISDIKPRLPFTATRALTCVLPALLLFSSLSSQPSWAASNTETQSLPSPEMLAELKRRLINAIEKPPVCAPECATIPKAELQITQDVLRLTMEVHAQAEVALPLPLEYNQWLPQTILLNGKAASTLRLHQQQAYLLLPAGVHQLSLQGRLPLLSSVRLPFPLNPHYLTAQSDNWLVQGVTDGQVVGQVQLIRQQKDSNPDGSPSQALPPFVLLERHLQLGLDWHIETRVIRLGDSSNTVSLEIPLLAGESVLSADTRVKAGKVQLTLAGGQSEASWFSALSKTAELHLKASDTQQWMERWRVSPSAIWRIEAKGLPEVMAMTGATSWSPEWWPWPGETLNLKIQRPAGIDGNTLTVDETLLQIEPGNRSSQVSYHFKLRSSQGQLHQFSLPAGAELQQVLFNQQALPIQAKQGKVVLDIPPGAHAIQIDWLQTGGITGFYRSPSFDIGMPGVNNNIVVNVPHDRWILLAGGPSFGPAVLFWGVLLVMLLISWGLARSRYTPLSTAQWLLLCIGLSQLPILMALVVASWFFVLAWRQQNLASSRLRFNLLQLAIIALSLLAAGFLIAAVWQGLLGSPDMQIRGNSSYNTNLRWYQDRISGLQPEVWVISVPLFVYRLLMLLWSLWLAFALLRWVQWGWAAFSQGGLWRKSSPKATAHLEIDEIKSE